MLISVILGSHSQDVHFLPHALAGLMNQEFKDFELVVTMKSGTGVVPDVTGKYSNTLPARYYYLPANDTGGNRERRFGLHVAQGRYVAWLSADNLVYPNWLSNHARNIAERDGAASVINTHHWHRGGYQGVMPGSLECGRIDLLNFALPTGLARRTDAFGPATEYAITSDWFAFEPCARESGAVWHPDQPVCACHF